MTIDKEHPEQDPAQGSRETIERDLAQKDRRADRAGLITPQAISVPNRPAGTALRPPRNNEA